jgi:hypothetical protein
MTDTIDIRTTPGGTRVFTLVGHTVRTSSRFRFQIVRLPVAGHPASPLSGKPTIIGRSNDLRTAQRRACMGDVVVDLVTGQLR